MSLQGTLETFALPDVLVLLSSTKKDGELRVTGGRTDGKVWLEKGQIVHARIGETEAEPVDAIFELLRLQEGTFNFENDSAAPKSEDPQAIDGVLADAQIRLGEWNEIAKVVPHLDCVVDMAAEAPADEVIVSRDQWSMLRRVAGGRSVHDLMVALGHSEFDTCKTVKELVDSKLASIDVDAKPKPKPKPAPAPAPESNGKASSPADAAPRSKSADIVEAAEAKAAKEKADRVQAKSDAADAETADAEDRARQDADADPAAKGANDGRPGIAAAKVAEPADPAKISASTTGTPKLGEREPDRVARQDELDALAELASRPRKVRASSSTEAEDGETGSRPTATKAPVDRPVEEAKALVAQLAALSGDDEAEVAAKVTEHLAHGGELPEVPDGDEPINRGLLLKFLSSVRN